MSKKCIAILVLLLIIAGGAYKFMPQSNVSSIASNDGRKPIALTVDERDLVLKEMRGFVIALQQINEGLSKNEMTLISTAARKSGFAAKNEIPKETAQKLPMPFKKLAGATHKQFDAIAQDAEDLEDVGHTLSQVATLMKNCIVCHSAYRFDLSSQ